MDEELNTPLGTEVDLGTGHIVLDGVAALRETGTAAPPHLFGPCLLWPRLPISATAELLLTRFERLKLKNKVMTHRQTLFNGLFSRTTCVSWHQEGQTNLDFNEARDDWVAVSSAGPYYAIIRTSLQTDNHASTSSLIFLQAGCSS